MTKDLMFPATQAGLTLRSKIQALNLIASFPSADIRRIGRLDNLMDRTLLLQAYFNAFLQYLVTGTLVVMSGTDVACGIRVSHLF